VSVGASAVLVPIILASTARADTVPNVESAVASTDSVRDSREKRNPVPEYPKPRSPPNNSPGQALRAG
jgi:hypothetical protein